MARSTAAPQRLKAQPMTTLETPPAAGRHTELETALHEACRRLPPLWPLQNFVAVNPFFGLSDRPFIEAASLIRRVGHGDILMPAQYYLDAIDSGRITEQDFALAAKWAASTLPATWAGQMDYASLGGLRRALQSERSRPVAPRVLTFAD